MLPHAVYGNARGEWMSRIRQPLRQAKARTGPLGIPRAEHGRGGRLEFLGFVRLIVHAAVQQIRRARLGQFVQDHHRIWCTGLRPRHGGLHHLDFHRIGGDEFRLRLRQVRPALRNLDERRAVAVVRPETGLVDVVEKCEQPVKILLRNRIVFMIVAARARQREAEEHRAHRLHAIGHVFHNPFVRNRATLGVDAVVAVEARGHLREKIAVRQQVARHLFGHKPIKRHIVIERLDQPIAPHPHVTQSIVLVAVRIGIPRSLHPAQRHVLAIARRSQQPVDRFFIRIR